MARIPAYRRNANCVTRIGTVKISSAASPIAVVATAISMAVALVAAHSAIFASISSRSAMPNRARTVSARIIAAISTSVKQDAITTTPITASSRYQARSRPSIGRKHSAITATVNSRRAIASGRGVRPTAMCGSEPTSMPTAVTATTCSAECSAGTTPSGASGAAPSGPTPTSSAYPIAPALAIGATSRLPGITMRNSSPSAISTPKMSATLGWYRPTAATCVIATTTNSPAVAISSSWPESMVCHAARSRAGIRPVVTGAAPRRRR
ncbi:hypothetical protein GCM10009736_40300 [Actinomadura bangladeshensis]